MPAENLTSGNSLTVYAVSRDSNNNFVANVAATWSLTSITGGVQQSTDLVSNSTNATITEHLAGSAKIKALSTGFTDNTTGTITVISGTENTIRVETAADGSGI